MADERISSFITPEALAELAMADEAMESLSERIIKANADIKNAEGFVKQAKSIKDLSTATDTLNKEQEKQAKAAEKLIVQQEKLSAAAAKAAQAAQQKAAVDKLAEDSLKKLSQTLDKARDGYNKLTAAERENVNIGGVLLNRIKELDTQLKASDASMGKFNRNVGNYSGAMNGLRGSMQQIARELPSISGGFAIFASAIGNNIAPAQDALRAFREEQKLLQAEGKPTISVFKALGGALFNWQTALLLAVTALTVYGKEIGEFAKSLFTTKKATDEATLSQEAFNEALKSATLKSGIAEYKELEYQIGLVGKGLATEKQVVEQYNKTLGVHLGFQKDIAGVKAQLVQKGPFYLAFLVEEAKAQILVAKAVEATLALQQKQQDIKLGKTTASEAIQGAIDLLLFRDKNADPQKQRNADALKVLQDELDNTSKALEVTRAKQQALSALGDFSILPEELKKEGAVKKVKDLTAAYERLNEEIQKFANAQRNPTKSELDSIFSDIDKEDLGKVVAGVLTEEAEKNAKKKADGLLAVLQDYFKKKERLTKEQEAKDKKRAEILSLATEINAEANKLGGELADLQKALSAGRIADLDREIDKINEKRTADILAIEASMASEEEKRRKIAEINIVANAEEKKQDREKIAALRKAAIFEKAITISQIIANTALAVVKALPNYVLAAFVAGSGAVALANAIAQPIPQYEKGTQGKAHKGGPALLFEGGKTEAVIENGRVWTGDKEGIYDLAAGAHVVSNKDLMRMANMYTLGMPALIPQRNRMMDNEAIKQGLEQVRKAIENKPVSQMSITNGGITGLVRTGQQNIQYLNNLKC